MPGAVLRLRALLAFEPFHTLFAMATEPTEIEAGAEPEEGAMSFGDHLEELRSRLFKGLIATFLVFLVVFIYHEDVMRFVTAPYLEKVQELKLDATLKAKGVSTGFFAYMKVCFIVALIAAAPVLIYQIWAFVAAGLYKNERKVVYRTAPLMLILFLSGVYFGYKILIPIGLGYLLTFPDPDLIQNWIGISEYLSFFAILTLVLGVAFELPVAMALLAKVGVMTIAGFRDKRRYFILGAFVLGALLTPPDVITQVLLATPLLFLYEFGIFLAWIGMGKERPGVNWPLWRKRAIFTVLIGGGFAFFWNNLEALYDRRQVGQRIISPDSETATVPRFHIFAGLESKLGYRPKQALRLAIEPDPERELWIVEGDGRADVINLNFETNRTTKTGETTDGAIFLLQRSQVVVAAVLEKEPDGDDVFGLIMKDFEIAAIEDAIVLNDILSLSTLR